MEKKRKPDPVSVFADRAFSAFAGAVFSSLGGYVIHKIVNSCETKSYRKNKFEIGFDMKGEM